MRCAKWNADSSRCVYKTEFQHLNFLKNKDHHHSWEKLGFVKIDLLWTGRKRLQKTGDHQDDIKVSLSWQESHVVNIPKGRVFLFSLISGVLGTSEGSDAVNRSWPQDSGRLLSEEGWRRTGTTLPWSFPLGRRLLLRLDLRRSLRGPLRLSQWFSWTGLLKMPWERKQKPSGCCSKYFSV